MLRCTMRRGLTKEVPRLLVNNTLHGVSIASHRFRARTSVCDGEHFDHIRPKSKDDLNGLVILMGLFLR